MDLSSSSSEGTESDESDRTDNWLSLGDFWSEEVSSSSSGGPSSTDNVDRVESRDGSRDKATDSRPRNPPSASSKERAISSAGVGGSMKISREGCWWCFCKALCFLEPGGGIAVTARRAATAGGTPACL